MLPITPNGPHLSTQHAKTLDDEFFRSNPLAYFSSRIAGLLDAQHNSNHPSPESAAAFLDVLSLNKTDSVFAFSDRDRGMQVAVDAIALRHHAAEGIIRLLYALTVARPDGSDAPCAWLALARCPRA